MWGDPLLSQWEGRFINNVSQAGWLYEYTARQKTKIKEVFKKILRRRNIKKKT